ncbi:MAG TPA: hypothetical protein VF458_11595, partial [Ktedonobacteraceae bacterium]
LGWKRVEICYNLIMRAIIGIITNNSEILPGVHLLEVRAEQVARAARAGQYCMLRGADQLAGDPLLRRPFFVAEVDSVRGVCRFLVYARGRVASWLARQQPGMELDLLGPLGHGWMLRPETRNLLLLGEDPLLASLLLLTAQALENELAVTLIHCVAGVEQAYPAALLPPEVEYQVFALSGEQEKQGERLAGQLGEYLAWADAVCCSLSARTLALLARGEGRWREKHFVQAVVERPLLCVTGGCLGCQVETRSGPRLVCRDGPVFALRDLVEEG